MSRRKLGRWKAKVKEYMSERSAGRGTSLEQTMRVFGEKDGGCSAIATHLRYLYIYIDIVRWKVLVREEGHLEDGRVG